MSKEAMKLALEALEDLQRQYAIYPNSFWDWSKGRNAITALREALAEQPAQQCKWPTCQSEEAQQALAEQIKRELVGEQPAQRTWVGLTDEEKHEAVSDEIGRIRDYEDYADAIEAKLRDKNQ